MRLYDAATMRALDNATISEVGVPGIVLMENAGRATVDWMLRHWRDDMFSGVSVLCGRGNNGGDGFVIARHLHNAGVSVRVFVFASGASLQGDAARNLSIVMKMGISTQEVLSEETWNAVRANALERSVIVDALVGTGLRAEITGLLRLVIEDVNRAARTVMAVDIPSGVDASSGQIHGVAVRATATSTFGAAKMGLALDPGASRVGQLIVVDIGIPREMLMSAPEQGQQVEASDVAGFLPQRPESGHKGTFGHLAVVAGSAGRVGAAVLSCHAALRSGVGLVTLALPRSAAAGLPSIWPEIMVELIPDEGAGHFTRSSLPRVLEVLQGKHAAVIGPGLSASDQVGHFVERLLERSSTPKVIDADGLNVLIGRTDCWQRSAGSLILTPHPGEAARQLSQPVSAIQTDRLAAVRTLAERTQATVVLKGARTLVIGKSGRVSVNPTGNSGLGTAGTGDALSGLIGGLLAQGASPEDAAVAGVYIHGLAGDIGADKLGMRALTASDVIDHLGAAFRRVLGREA